MNCRKSTKASAVLRVQATRDQRQINGTNSCNLATEAAWRAHRHELSSTIWPSRFFMTLFGTIIRLNMLHMDEMMKKCCFGFNGNSYCPRRAVFIELQPEDGCNNPPLCAWVPVRTCLAPLSWLPVWVCQSFVNVLHWHFESCFLFELKTSSVLKALHPTLLALEFAETPARAAAGGKTCCSKCARRAEGWISDQLKEMDYFQNWPQMTQMYENSMKFISCF